MKPMTIQDYWLVRIYLPTGDYPYLEDHPTGDRWDDPPSKVLGKPTGAPVATWRLKVGMSWMS